MKKTLLSILIATSMITPVYARGNHHHHHHHRPSWGKVIIGTIIAGAVAGAVYRSNTPQPQYVAPPPQYYMDNQGNIYNQYGTLICAGLPIYDHNGRIVGFNRGC